MVVAASTARSASSLAGDIGETLGRGARNSWSQVECSGALIVAVLAVSLGISHLLHDSIFLMLRTTLLAVWRCALWKGRCWTTFYSLSAAWRSSYS